MKTRKRTIRRKRIIKYVEICAAVLLIAAIVWMLVTAYNPNAPIDKPKPEASAYFAFSDLGAIAQPFNGTTDVVKLKEVDFKLTPIGGNATNVQLDPGGDTALEDYFYPKITNGTAQEIDVKLGKSVESTKEGTTFPIEIHVYCVEAEGYVTLQIPETSIFHL